MDLSRTELKLDESELSGLTVFNRGRPPQSGRKVLFVIDSNPKVVICADEVEFSINQMRLTKIVDNVVFCLVNKSLLKQIFIVVAGVWRYFVALRDVFRSC